MSSAGSGVFDCLRSAECGIELCEVLHDFNGQKFTAESWKNNVGNGIPRPKSMRAIGTPDNAMDGASAHDK